MTPEQKEHIRLWIAALRSDEFVQQRSKLRGDQNERCCLGVACDVYQRETGDGRWERTPGKFGQFFSNAEDEGSSLILPEFVADWLGVDNDPSLYFSRNVTAPDLTQAEVKAGNPIRASVANDAFKVTFAEIADALEQAIA